MKTTAVSSLRLWTFLACCGLFAPSVYAEGFLDFLLPRDELQTICVTDVTPAGRLRRLPSPTAPVYYVAVSAGYRDFGGVKNGERAIPRQLVNETMLKVLAKQGYLPVPQNQHPDIALVWTWGTLNVERTGMSLGVGNSQINRQQMLRFMGGDKVGLTSEFGDPFPEQTLKLGLVFDGSDVRDLPDVARHDLYVAVINAYDVKLNDLNHGVLLWNTRISCPSRGYWLSEALPAMLVMASPNIGRETIQPVWLRATERFKPKVKLGDLKVVEYLENNRQAVVETGPSS